MDSMLVGHTKQQVVDWPLAADYTWQSPLQLLRRKARKTRKMTEMQAQIRLSYVQRIESVIDAYFRTSPHGEWAVDGGIRAESFVMRYRRGDRSWMGVFGFGGRWLEYEYVYPSILAKGRAQFPMLLKIVVRPSPQSLVLFLTFNCRSAYPVQSGRTADRVEADQKIIDRWFGEIVSADTQGLVEYLQEFYCLADAPELTLPIANQPT
jgi:hypothetical protein